MRVRSNSASPPTIPTDQSGPRSASATPETKQMPSTGLPSMSSNLRRNGGQPVLSGFRPRSASVPNLRTTLGGLGGSLNSSGANHQTEPPTTFNELMEAGGRSISAAAAGGNGTS